MQTGFQLNPDSEKSKYLKSKELNNDIMSSIKKVRQKLTLDSTTKQNQQFQQKIYTEFNSRKGANAIEKTVNLLKNKISDLQKQNVQLRNQIKKNNDSHLIQIQLLKAQLSKFIEKQFQATIQQNLYPNVSSKQNNQNVLEKTRKIELQLIVFKEKLKNSEDQKNDLEKKICNLSNQLNEIQKEKQKHIELNIMDKMKFEEQIGILTSQKDKKGSIIQKLEQENINLKRQIHSIFNNERFSKQSSLIEKKSQEQYQFQIKQLTQKFTIKLKNQQKQINLLRKTIQKFKQTPNESDISRLNDYQHQIQFQKQKILEKDKKITQKNIQIQKLNSIISNINQSLKQKQLQVKALMDLINNKDILEKDLTNKLAKNGISFNTTKQNSKSLHRSSKSIIAAISTDREQESEHTLTKILKTHHSRNLSSNRDLQQKDKKPNINDIATQQRALATLKSNYKNINNKQLSLNDLMLQIRRKTDKINDLRSQKSKDVK